jgi:hypothetical protein
MPKLTMQGLAGPCSWGHIDQNRLFELLKNDKINNTTKIIVYVLFVSFLLRFIVQLKTVFMAIGMMQANVC